MLDANSNIVDADYERGYRAGNDLTSYTDFTTKLRVVTAFLNFQIYIWSKSVLIVQVLQLLSRESRIRMQKKNLIKNIEKNCLKIRKH